jgi:hypothetical protein
MPACSIAGAGVPDGHGVIDATSKAGSAAATAKGITNAATAAAIRFLFMKAPEQNYRPAPKGIADF